MDIPVQLQVMDFSLSPDHVGLPDKDGEGHIHVMLDGWMRRSRMPFCTFLVYRGVKE